MQLGDQFVQESLPFGPISADKRLMPVALPPGRARLATRPSLTGSCAGRRRSESSRWQLGRAGTIAEAGCSDHGHTTADELGHERRQAVVLAVQPVVLDHHVLALEVAP